MSALAVLIAARERIAMPERWTQGHVARSADGIGRPADSPRATCWCSLGALRVASPRDADAYWDARGFLRAAAGCGAIPDWNDAPARTHAEVIAAFDAAIELARKEGTR